MNGITTSWDDIKKWWLKYRNRRMMRINRIKSTLPEDGPTVCRITTTVDLNTIWILAIVKETCIWSRKKATWTPSDALTSLLIGAVSNAVPMATGPSVANSPAEPFLSLSLSPSLSLLPLNSYYLILAQNCLSFHLAIQHATAVDPLWIKVKCFAHQKLLCRSHCHSLPFSCMRMHFISQHSCSFDLLSSSQFAWQIDENMLLMHADAQVSWSICELVSQAANKKC